MTIQTYTECLTDEINENEIKLIDHIDAVDLTEMVFQDGKYFNQTEASIILEEFLAEQE